MDTSSLPEWAQFAGIVAVAIVSAIIGVYKYVKTQVTSDSTTVPVASGIDSRLIRDVITAIRENQDEQGRDSKKSHRLAQDLKESINELNETIIIQTDATINLVKYINRQESKTRVRETMNFGDTDK